ncbi:hypothetical protein LINPERHAP2_LOCUS29148 [Linum perenne]
MQDKLTPKKYKPWMVLLFVWAKVFRQLQA